MGHSNLYYLILIFTITLITALWKPFWLSGRVSENKRKNKKIPGLLPPQPRQSLKNTSWQASCFIIVKAGKSYLRGRLSTVDLRVLTSLDQLHFYCKFGLLLPNMPP